MSYNFHDSPADAANITLRIQADEQQQKKKEYPEKLDSGTEGNFVVDFEKDEIYCSEDWMRRLGIENTGAVRTLARFMESMLPEDAYTILSDKEKAAVIKPRKFRREYMLTDRNGEKLWVMVQGKLIYNSGGRLIQTCGTFIDITARKDIELALKTQADELAEKNRLVNNFFLSVSHEFRTPLSVLLMSLDMMDLHLAEARCLHGNRIQGVCSEMRNNVYRLMNLSQNMLDTVKLDAGFDKPCYKDTDVVALAADITNVVSSHVARGNIHVSFSANAASFLMPADTDKIEKILLNLLSNAVKHSPPGGQVGVTLSVDSASLLIIVSDEGPGISEDRIKTIFSRFRPADALARSQEGCGIGLSLSKALAELMGGHICVESRAEHGSRFYVELPVPSTAEVHPFTLDDGLTLEQKVQIAFSDITLSGDNGSNLKTPPP